MSVNTSRKCGYCHAEPERFKRSPRGRPYCPDCGAIPAEHQRDDGEFEDHF